MKIIGMPKRDEVKHLRSVCDELYLPRRKDGEYFTEYRGGGMGNNAYPEIILFKRFSGDFDIVAEQMLQNFYGSIASFVVERNITGRFVLPVRDQDLKGITLAKTVKEYARIDVNDTIQQSTPTGIYEFAPRVSVRVEQPTGKEFPFYERTLNGWKPCKRESTVVLQYMPPFLSNKHYREQRATMLSDIANATDRTGLNK